MKFILRRPVKILQPDLDQLAKVKCENAYTEINARKVKNKNDSEAFRARMMKNMEREKELILKAKSLQSNRTRSRLQTSNTKPTQEN